MPRGMKLFGWGFIVSGGRPLLDAYPVQAGCMRCSMRTSLGASFGGFHLAYGLYLYFTENRRMRREPRTVSPARPCHSREGKNGDHGLAGRVSGTFLHGTA